MKSKITKIITGDFFTKKNIADIIIKSKKQAIISLQIDQNIDLKKADKKAKEIEENIKQQLQLEKVTVFLTAQKESSQLKNDQNRNVKPIKEKLSDFFKKDQVGNAKQDKKEKDSEKKQQKLWQQNKIPNVKNIVAVASAKGGVGKSTIAANMAYSFKKIGYRVAIVDADIYGPSIAYLMNNEENPVNKDGKVIPLQQDGIKFISVANLIKKDEAGVWRAAMINKILNQILLQTDWGFDQQEVDLMIIDMPPGTGDIYLSIAQNFAIDGAVLVSTPQSLSQIDLVRSIDCFKKLQVEIFGLIENMSYFQDQQGQKVNIFGDSKLPQLALEQKINMLAILPLDPQINQEKGSRIFCKNQSSSPFGHQIGMVCEKIGESL